MRRSGLIMPNMPQSQPWIVCLLLALAINPANAQIARRCAHCNIVIIGEYLDVKGRIFHIDHFLCASCNKPMTGSYIRVGEECYHEACYDTRIAPRCSGCNEIVEGERLEDHWGNVYHRSHNMFAVDCDFCGRLVMGGFAAGSRRFADGRELCAFCAPTAVTSVQAAESIMVQTARLLDSCGLSVPLGNVSVILATQEQLDRCRRTEEEKLRGFTEYLEWDVGKHDEHAAQILLLDGMARVEATFVMAHELMHVWMFRRGIVVDDIACEGSAQYAASLIMKKMGTAECEFMLERALEDPNPIYGEGYRHVKRYCEKKGMAAWLDALRAESSVLLADD